jgi:hypothetical protein
MPLFSCQRVISMPFGGAASAERRRFSLRRHFRHLFSFSRRHAYFHDCRFACPLPIFLRFASMSLRRRLRRLYDHALRPLMPFAPLPITVCRRCALLIKAAAISAAIFAAIIMPLFHAAIAIIIFAISRHYFHYYTPRPDYFRRRRHFLAILPATPPCRHFLSHGFLAFDYFHFAMFSPPPCRLFSLSHFVFAID